MWPILPRSTHRLRYMVSGNSLELPIDVVDPAPALSPARAIADRKAPGADLAVRVLAHHRVHKIPPGGLYLAKYDVADTNISNLAHRMVLAYSPLLMSGARLSLPIAASIAVR